MTGSEAPAPRADGMYAWQLWLGLAAVTTVFLAGLGPVWNDPYAIDESIVWSYLLIPVVVAAFLLANRTMSWRALFLGTLEITMFKFGITLSIAVVLWIAVDPKPKIADPEPAFVPRVEAPAPEPSVIPPQSTGTLRVVVRDASGAATEGAWVWIDRGLEDLVFAPPPGAATLANDGAGFRPELLVVHPRQGILRRSLDGQLHTAAAYDAAGTVAFSIPMLGNPADETLVLGRGSGLYHLRCRVHEAVPGERAGWLLVAPNPFVAQTDESGTVELRGVPARDVVVRAFSAGATGFVEARIQAQETFPAQLTLGAPAE